LFAAVAGSNIGAYFTPVGALAGILWMSLLSRYGVKVSFCGFLRYCAPVAILTMAATLLGLWMAL
jgi:arsenical pump membrane protein